MTVEHLPVHEVEPHKFKTGHSLRSSEFLFPKSVYHDVKISVSHWQLRDLVCRNSLALGQVIFPTGEDINVIGLRSGNIKKKGSFDFAPRCFKELDGIVVAGGVQTSGSSLNSSRGQFGILVGETGYNQSINVGSLINNCVSIYKISNANYRSLICNNDQYLYTADITPSGVFTQSGLINLGIPLNHATLSPDQKTIVTCGDSSDFFILHPEEHNEKKQICTQYDNGFSTSFHPNGLMFTTTFQEGVALVYDVRNLAEPVHIISSTRRNSQNGAFRCCKFSSGTDDLLFISEHVGRVHMIDTRDFSNHQVIMLPQMIKGRSPLNSDCKDSYNESLVRPFEDVMANFNNFARNNLEELESPSYPSRSRWSRHSLREERVNRLITVRLPARQYAQQQHQHQQQAQNYLARMAASGNDNTTNNAFYELCDTELSGLEWLETSRGSSLVIGCSKGIIKWDVNCWSRRCFPSYAIS